MRTFQRLTPLLAIAAAAVFGIHAAHAAEPSYPTHPVKVVVPSVPGGPIDTVSRLVSDKLGASTVASARSAMTESPSTRVAKPTMTNRGAS